MRSDVEEDEETAIDVLLDTLSCDPAATPSCIAQYPHRATVTLDAILARTRDADTVKRRLVYSAVLEKHFTTLDGSGIGLVHPRVLSIAQRELIIRNGLVIVARGDATDEEGKTVHDDVLVLLNPLDLNESTITEDALLSVFATRVDIFDQLEFKGEQSYQRLIRVTAVDHFFCQRRLLGRSDSRTRAGFRRALYCHERPSQARGVPPVVTLLAFRIQNAYNKYQDDLEAAEQEHAARGALDEERAAREEDERLDKEAVIGEMLKLAVNLDYADEIGRRKMFQLVRDMISQEALPESLVARYLDVLRQLSPSERDLIRVVVEVVHELRDSGEVEEEVEKDAAGEGEAPSFSGTPSATATAAPKPPKPPKELSPEDQARVDAVDLRCLSLRVCMLERVNGRPEGILGELIAPAVKRKELVLRGKGLVCLGLCCLIARRMALNSFQLFLSQIQAAPEMLQTRVLYIVFDVLMVHEGDFLGRNGFGGDRIVEFFLHILNNEDSEKVPLGSPSWFWRACSLMSECVLKSLVVAYLSPDTVENQELRQRLSYFFLVYCYSSAANQRRMRQISIPMFEQLSAATRELDDDQEMVTPAQIIGMFVDWTDPQKAIEVEGQTIDDSVHIDLADDIRALFKDELESASLGRQEVYNIFAVRYPSTLALPPTLTKAADLTFQRRPLRDAAARNAFTKFDAAASKKYADKLVDFSEEEYRQLEQLNDLFKFLDDIIPLDDVEDYEVPKTRGRKRSVKKPQVVQVITDEDEDENEDEAATPAPSRRRNERAAAPKADARPSSGGNTTFDSIMDSEDEEEEEEEHAMLHVIERWSLLGDANECP
ncbi:nuclear condensing complex subunit [Melanogaster broomeanus]|nr:nuclear condensing complex subunit [Melanogaster broomeanus]